MGTREILVIALAVDLTLNFGYRVYRLARGGSLADVAGQGLLALLLAGVAVAVAQGQGWATVLSLAYAALYGLVVLPLWVLAVLIPSDPGPPDYVYTGLHVASLITIAVCSILL